MRLLPLILVLGCAPAEEDGGDASAPDVRLEDAEVDAQASCVSDPLEALEPGDYGAQLLCAETVEAALLVEAGQLVGVELEAEAPLRMALIGPSGVLSEDEGTDLHLEARAPEAGLRLRLTARVETEYTLRIARLAADCEDPMEPDLQAEDAPRLGPGEVLERALCADDADWIWVPVEPGAPLEVEVLHAGGGALAVGLHHDHRVPALEGVVEVGETGRYDQLRADPRGRILVRLRPADGVEAAYRVVARLGPGTEEVQRFEGTLEVLDRAVTEAGLGEALPVPGAGLRVDAIAPDGAILSSTLTDAEGAYALEASTPNAVELRVAARTPAVRVSSPSEASRAWTAPLDDLGEAAGAFHVALTAQAGLDALADWLPPLFAPAAFRWQPEFAADCTTCFRPGSRPYVSLSGSIRDPDEWDEDIILHELGHILAVAHSRDDSPGGPHGGDRSDPRLAWSEGWAIFHASWQSGVPLQLDYKADGVRARDYESMDAEQTFGVDERGYVSEWLVAAVLWDLHDDGPDDDDAVSVPDEALFDAFRALAVERVDEVDLSAFLDALACETAVDFSSVLEARDYPHVPRCD